MAVQIFLSYRIFKFTSYQQWSHRLLYIYITHIHYTTLILCDGDGVYKYIRRIDFLLVFTILLQILHCHDLTCTFFYTILFVLLYHHRITKATTFEISGCEYSEKCVYLFYSFVGVFCMFVQTNTQL